MNEFGSFFSLDTQSAWYSDTTYNGGDNIEILFTT